MKKNNFAIRNFHVRKQVKTMCCGECFPQIMRALHIHAHTFYLLVLHWKMFRDSNEFVKSLNFWSVDVLIILSNSSFGLHRHCGNDFIAEINYKSCGNIYIVYIKLNISNLCFQHLGAQCCWVMRVCDTNLKIMWMCCKNPACRCGKVK